MNGRHPAPSPLSKLPPPALPACCGSVAGLALGAATSYGAGHDAHDALCDPFSSGNVLTGSMASAAAGKVKAGYANAGVSDTKGEAKMTRTAASPSRISGSVTVDVYFHVINKAAALRTATSRTR